MATPRIKPVPRLFLAADDGGWLVNVGLWVWQTDALHPRAARRLLREQGRKIRCIDGRGFVLCLPEEVAMFYSVAARWRPLLTAELRRLSRRG
jgi:hypothetical protein